MTLCVELNQDVPCNLSLTLGNVVGVGTAGQEPLSVLPLMPDLACA